MQQTLHLIINEIRKAKGQSLLEEINETDTLRNDYGFDSFDLAELTVQIEDKFGVDIFEEGIIETVKEIFGKLSR